MKAKLLRLRDDKGAAVIEMAIALPVVVMFIYGIYQMSLLYWANAGMQHALGEGARFATLYTERTVTTTVNGTTTTATVTYPEASAVKSAIEAELFGQSDGTFTVFDPDTSTAGSYLLRVRYVRTMNFIFISGPTITVNREKRVYLTTA